MLSKSKYCAFIQCPKNLWLKVYKPELATIDEAVEARFKVGNEVGDLAMGLFGDFTEVTTLDQNGRLDLKAMISKTNDLIANGENVICEASFSYEGNYCAVDILKKENDGYAIYEVKSSTKSSPIYEADIAYQKYVLEHCGIRVSGTYLVCINNSYIYDGNLDINEFFKIIDLSSGVEEHIKYVENNIKIANEVLESKHEPKIDLCQGCHEPYDCAFWEYCSKHLPKPSVFDLYGISFKTALEYYHKGVISYADLKNDSKIMKNKVRSLQITHELSDLEPNINKKEIQRFLGTLSYPLYFLDFETMQPVIPEYIGTKPYAQIPFQYSLHYIEAENGELKHKEFLGISGQDPRRALAEQLCKDIPVDACVLAFNKSFECTRIKELAECYQDLADHLLSIEANIVDLVVPFRAGYCYNRAMGGSFSIKSILPALYPNDPALDYHNLEGVHNGTEAKDIFPKIKAMSPQEQEKTRYNLLKYCELDTLALVKLWQELIRVSK